jgi:hypothetical protein
LPAGQADDLVIGRLAPDILVARNRAQDRDADRGGEGFASPVPSSLFQDHAGNADIAAHLAEILDRLADVVGDVEGLEVVRGDHDHLLAHVAGNRQAEAAAHHVAEEVEQDVVEAPFVEAEFLEQLEAMDDARAAAAAADFGPPSSIANTPSRWKQTSSMRTSSPASFLMLDVSMMVGQLLPPNSSWSCPTWDRSRSAARACPAAPSCS